eukprot:3183584-Prymnesium_polylepis.1
MRSTPHGARDGHVGRAGRAAAAPHHGLAGEGGSGGGAADGGGAAVDGGGGGRSGSHRGGAGIRAGLAVAVGPGEGPTWARGSRARG